MGARNAQSVEIIQTLVKLLRNNNFPWNEENVFVLRIDPN